MTELTKENSTEQGKNYNKKVILPDADTVSDAENYEDLRVFDQFGKTVMLKTSQREEFLKEVQDADAILLNKVKINRETLGDNPSVKFIGLFATGYNVIDLDYCNEHGITVCNVPTYSSNAVAQHTFAFILEHFSKTSKYNDFVHEGGWVNSGTFAPFVFQTNELAGKTIGLLGYGKIGHQVAKIAKAFGMDVLVYTRSFARAKEQNNNTDLEGFIDRAEREVTYVTLDNLFKHSDIVSIHCPLNPESEGLINKETIAKMRDGAFLVNTSRGPIINEQDLAEALKSGKLSGAGIDVLETEPMRADCVLLDAPNCIITPHVAWCPVETRKRLIKEVVKNYEAFLKGRPINTVN